MLVARNKKLIRKMIRVMPLWLSALLLFFGLFVFLLLSLIGITEILVEDRDEENLTNVNSDAGFVDNRVCNENRYGSALADTCVRMSRAGIGGTGIQSSISS